MQSCETTERLHSSWNSHCRQPAELPQIMQFSSFTLSHFSCFTPCPFDHMPISFASIFWLQTIQSPGNFIVILRQLILATLSPFLAILYNSHLGSDPVFCFASKTKWMGNKRLQRCSSKRAKLLSCLMQVIWYFFHPISVYLEVAKKG